MNLPDFIEVGTGPRVILVHSSVSGARQWRVLMDVFSDRWNMVAVNLFGYGATPAWQAEREQTLEDQARLIAPFLEGADSVALVGHSLGGTVAMKAAQLFKDRVRKLVLIEPNAFFLLDQAGCHAAMQEVMALRHVIKSHGATGSWAEAAAYFADYWTGAGSWAAMPTERQQKFVRALQPNFHEWDGFLSETTMLPEWYAALPGETSVIWSRDTVRSIRDIVELMQQGCPDWRFESLETGGHMAALTHPERVNPLIEAALRR